LEQISNCYINQGGGGVSLAQTLKKLNFTRSLGVVLEEKSQQMQNLLKQES